MADMADRADHCDPAGTRRIAKEVIICGLCYDELCFAVDELEQVKQCVVLPDCGHCYHTSCITAAHSAQRSFRPQKLPSCPMCNVAVIQDLSRTPPVYTRLFLDTAPAGDSHPCFHSHLPAAVCEKAASVFRLAAEYKDLGNTMTSSLDKYLACGEKVPGDMQKHKVAGAAIAEEMQVTIDRALEVLQICKSNDAFREQINLFTPKVERVAAELARTQTIFTTYIDRFFTDQKLQVELTKHQGIHKGEIAGLKSEWEVRQRRIESEAAALRARCHHLEKQAMGYQEAQIQWRKCEAVSTQLEIQLDEMETLLRKARQDNRRRSAPFTGRKGSRRSTAHDEQATDAVTSSPKSPKNKGEKASNGAPTLPIAPTRTNADWAAADFTFLSPVAGRDVRPLKSSKVAAAENDSSGHWQLDIAPNEGPRKVTSNPERSGGLSAVTAKDLRGDNSPPEVAKDIAVRAISGRGGPSVKSDPTHAAATASPRLRPVLNRTAGSGLNAPIESLAQRLKASRPAWEIAESVKKELSAASGLIWRASSSSRTGSSSLVSPSEFSHAEAQVPSSGDRTPDKSNMLSNSTLRRSLLQIPPMPRDEEASRFWSSARPLLMPIRARKSQTPQAQVAAGQGKSPVAQAASSKDASNAVPLMRNQVDSHDRPPIQADSVERPALGYETSAATHRSSNRSVSSQLAERTRLQRPATASAADRATKSTSVNPQPEGPTAATPLPDESRMHRPPSPAWTYVNGHRRKQAQAEEGRESRYGR